MTAEMAYVGLWLIASAYFAVHTVWKRGGIMSSGSMVVMFVILFFASTNVGVGTGNGVESVSNPMLGWLALLMALASTVVLFLVIFGLADYGTDKESDEMDSAHDIISSV